jgi:hypothetical protein
LILLVYQLGIFKVFAKLLVLSGKLVYLPFKFLDGSLFEVGVFGDFFALVVVKGSEER